VNVYLCLAIYVLGILLIVCLCQMAGRGENE
jgi:hypothetical protein